MEGGDSSLASLRKLNEGELLQTLREAAANEKKRGQKNLLGTLRDLTLFSVDASTLEILTSLYHSVSDEKALRLIHYFWEDGMKRLQGQERERLLSSILGICEKELESKDTNRFVCAVHTLASVSPEDVAKSVLLRTVLEQLQSCAPVVASMRDSILAKREGKQGKGKTSDAEKQVARSLARLYASLSALRSRKEAVVTEGMEAANALAQALEAPDYVCVSHAAAIGTHALLTVEESHNPLLLKYVDQIKMKTLENTIKAEKANTTPEGITAVRSVASLLGAIAQRFSKHAATCLRLLSSLFSHPDISIALFSIMVGFDNIVNVRYLAQRREGEDETPLLVATKKVSSMLMGKGDAVTQLAVRISAAMLKKCAIFFRYCTDSERRGPASNKGGREGGEDDMYDEDVPEFEDFGDCEVHFQNPIPTLTSSADFTVRAHARLALLWLHSDIVQQSSTYLSRAISDSSYRIQTMEKLISELRERLEVDRKKEVALFAMEWTYNLAGSNPTVMPVTEVMKLWMEALHVEGAKEKVLHWLCSILDLPLPAKEEERIATASIRSAIFVLFGRLYSPPPHPVREADKLGEKKSDDGWFESGELSNPSPSASAPFSSAVPPPSSSSSSSSSALTEGSFDAVVSRLERAASFGVEGVRRIALTSLAELVQEGRCPCMKRRLGVMEFLVEMKRQSSHTSNASLSSALDAALAQLGLA